MNLTPDLDPGDEERIESRFRSGEFPEVMCSSMSRVIHKCWAGRYNSAQEVWYELRYVS